MKTTLVLFGITGDLSKRKLLPALEHIFDSGLYPDLSVMGVSRRASDVSALLTEAVGRSDHAERFSLFTMDLEQADDYARLLQTLAPSDDHHILIYLSVPPSASPAIVQQLGRAGLVGPNVRLLLEKPFGFDAVSADASLERIHQYYSEEQIYRIDHYMGKELTRIVAHYNVKGTWNAQSIDRIDIVASETIGIEGRSFFYEQTGALRDFLQGHLLELLAVTLSPRGQVSSTARQQALEQLNPSDPATAIRGQYEGYRGEVEQPNSQVETFAQLTLTSNDPRWQGVVMTIASGKAMNEKRSSVAVTHKDGSVVVIEEPTDLSGVKSAYETVFIEAIEGRHDIFISDEEVRAAWRIVAAVQQSWANDGTPLVQYEKGASLESIVGRAG